ncbi:MAG: multifunctional CCA addition/repair protein [Pseudomonadales bacterium]|nr:multifunctional CCA addition/repair protein [Gammaproteobacteria bacterium]MBP6481741.1 multifunctional CCA addition/repair protein [Pseudomonadales bacterium]
MQIYLVGGAVRDRMLGIPPCERDWVVVGASREQMLALGFRQVGRDFPVFLHPETGEEYALARRERKSGHGYSGFSCETGPQVSLEDDLARRDLSINAMAEDRDGCLIDPYGGAQDVRDGLLRHVSDAFVEDPLRVLRVARFMARFASRGFRIHPATMTLMRDMATSGELSHLVAERVWTETRRALGEASPQEYFRTLRECGALGAIFPEIEALFGVPQPQRHHPEIDTGEHVLLCLRLAAQLRLTEPARFAVLVHDLGKALTPRERWPSHVGHEKLGAVAVRALCERLRVPVKYRELALVVCLHHTRCHRVLEMRAPAIVSLLEDVDALRNGERFEEFLAACEADARGRTGLERHPYAQAEKLRRARAAAATVTAAPALARGLRGPQIAAEMHRLRCIEVARLEGEDHGQ